VKHADGTQKILKQKKPKSRRKAMHNKYGYLFMIPWFVGFFILTLGPMLVTLYLAFTKFDIFTPPKFIGLANFKKMFTNDPRFLASLGLTLKYVLFGVPGQLFIALVVALVLSRKIKGLGLYRAFYYLPSLVGISVAIAIVWRRLFAGDGILNIILATIGIEGPSWISNPAYSAIPLIIHRFWLFGTPMVIFLASRLQIPQYLYDSAKVDGSSSFRMFVSITLPMMTPIIFLNLVMEMINAFKAFTPAYIISGGTGGPLNSMLFFTLYLYQEAFTYLRLGYASALAWFLLMMTAAISGTLFLTSKYWVFYEEEN
jgi:multiple sugar transport system permease protein